jgi:hypothetical protein
MYLPENQRSPAEPLIPRRGPAHQRTALACALVGALAIAFLTPSPMEAATIGPPSLVGTITSSSLREVSGIVDSRAHADVFWVHNDSGEAARFFAISHEGALLGTFPLAGASSVDWEDAAIGPKPGGGAFLYFADIGDNPGSRSSITIYRTDEPTSTTSATIAAGSYARARLQYPGGARNAESMFVDPLTSDIYIVTKGATTQIFSTSAAAFDASLTTLTAHGVLGAPLSTATAADISPDGRHILVRNRSAGYLFERGVGQSVADALHGPGASFAIAVEPQGEAIGWSADGAGFYTSSETGGGPSAPINFYSFGPPRDAADFDGDGDVDANDLAVWQTHSGIDGWADADLDGDSDGEDFLVWQRRLSAAPTQSAVPEPASAALILAAVISAAATRRRSTASPRGPSIMIARLPRRPGGSVFDLLEVLQAERDLLQHGGRFVLDKVPRDARLLAGAQERREVDLARAQRRIVRRVGVTRQQTRRRARLHVLEVRQLEPVAVLFQQLHRVMPRMHDPKHVQLIAHELRLRLRHQHVEQRAVAMRLKLVAVRVVEERNPLLGQRLARLVEHGNRIATGLFIERLLVIDPRAASILEVEHLGFAGDPRDVVAIARVRKVAAHRGEAPRVQLFLKLFRRHAIRPRQLDVLEAHVANLVERPRHVFGKLIAQAVELQADRAFETRTRASVSGMDGARRRDDGQAGKQSHQRFCFQGDLGRAPAASDERTWMPDARQTRNGADGDRTRNLCLAKAALSQLSYGPEGHADSARRVRRQVV